MTRIVYLAHSGTAREIDAEDGLSAMQVARNHGIDAIDGDCGGERACGTCRVLVVHEWLDRVGRAEGDELEMLEFRGDVPDNARLSCQIRVRPELDGVVLLVPKNQDSDEFCQTA